jgi:hypothetical protein
MGSAGPSFALVFTLRAAAAAAVASAAAARFSASLFAFSFAAADMKNIAPAADCAAESHGSNECNGT